MATDGRQYECVVFGATGYTGKYTAEHIVNDLPTDFKWAIAGRSEQKLKTLINDLKALNPDGPQPGIEVAQLDKHDLMSLAKKTKVLVSTVGPYHKYGTPVVEACAETGTHYVDVTGEIPWVCDMVQQYHETARKTGAIMILQNGIESAPADLMVWRLVSLIRETLEVGTKEAIHTVYDMKASLSGGTLNTALSLFNSYSISQLIRAQQPWCLCPVAPPKQSTSKSFFETLTGVRTVNDLGTLTDSPQGAADIPIVHRTWGLYEDGKLYGPNFHLSAYMRTRNALTGFGIHVAVLSALTALLFPPARWLLKPFIYEPGQGPSKEEVSKEYAEWRTIAYPDVANSETSKRAYGRMRFDGGLYQFTGVFLAEAALIISREKTFAHELGGGILTPATLGERYLERLEKAGLKTEFKMMP